MPPWTENVLDSFNRADESPIAGNWTGPIAAGIAQLKLTSNALAPNTTFGGSWWQREIYPADQFAHITISAIGGSGIGAALTLYCRAQSVGTSSLDGYIVTYDDTSGIQVRLWREDNGSDTQIGSSFTTGTATAGDKIGVRAIGNTIEAWFAPAGTGVWQLATSAQDTTYRLPGFLGVAMDSAAPSVRGDNFGGGPFIEIPPAKPKFIYNRKNK